MNTLKIGQYIRAQRKAAGLTQQQLAQKLNVSFQAISKWENGDTLPDTGLLLDLAEALHSTTDKLLSGGAILPGNRRLMHVSDAVEGFAHIEASGRCFGENSTFFTGAVEGINQKMNIDILSYLHDPAARSAMIVEALIQGIMYGYSVDMDEVRASVSNPKMVSVIEGYLNQETGNRLMQTADGYRKAHKLTEGQILVMRKQNDQIVMFENDLSETAEQEILDAQKAPITELLCLWCSNGEPDVPSHAMRTGLLNAFPENASAIVYVRTGDGLVGKTLSSLM